MATQAIKGRRAKIRLSSTAGTGGVIFNEVRNWSLTPTQEMLDASSCDSSGWHETIPGQRGAIFRAEAVYAPNTSTVLTGRVSVDIKNLLKSLFATPGNGRLTGFSLEVNTPPTSTSGIGNSGQWLVGTHNPSTVRVASVTNFRVGGSYDDLQLFEFEVTMSQAVVYTSGSS